MICLICGRDNPEGVKFCCFCGASSANAFGVTFEKPIEISPENGQLEVSESDTLNSVTTENNDSASIFSQSPNLNSMPINPSVPRPGVIPTNSEQASAQSAAAPQPMPVYDNQTYAPSKSSAVPNTVMMNVPLESPSNERKNGSERKFTTLHIVLCLASTAVCAIAAGIFAGLYFSVV